MTRFLLAVVLAAVFAAPSFAADAWIVSATPLAGNQVEVRLGCSPCPQQVTIELVPVGVWVPGGQAANSDVSSWDPGKPKVTIQNTRTTSTVPGILDIHWGSGKVKVCALLTPRHQCAWNQGEQSCYLEGGEDPLFDQWCWQPDINVGACALKFPRCPS